VTTSSPAPGALAGVTVIDLSRVLGGPYCTQILGDHGADVLKVEPPQGDETRAWGPPYKGDASAYFAGVNRNKRGLVLDLKTESARETLLGLLAGADVLVENFRTGTLEGWGLGDLTTRFPRLVHCRVTGFGADGPLGGLPGYDAAVQAMTGLMTINGAAGGEPVRLGVPAVDMTSGLNAAVGILLALVERERSGRGQFVDITLFDCALSILHPHAANWLGGGALPGRSGNAHPNIAPYETLPTARGELFLAVGNDGQFAKLCAMLGRDLAADARFATNPARVANRVVLREVLVGLLAEHEAENLAARLMAGGVPAAPVLDVAQALAHPHTAHREMIVAGDFPSIASPVKLGRTPATYRRPPPAFAP
jgi:crotonobetainyl-CoA:carnitine CoA-transferase CaiB-like acyl-CoA transferase